MPGQIDRRRLLGGATAAVGLTLAGCADAGFGDKPVEGTIESPRAPGGRTTFLLRSAPSPKGLLVSLHGHGGDAQRSYDLGFDELAVKEGFAFVSVSGGDGYWHARRDGVDAGQLVVYDLIPRAMAKSALGLSAPVGFIGWSMGGYGALLLASQMPKGQTFGVAGMSAALWTRPGDAARGAFEDAQDFREHDVFARSRRLAGIPVTLACGRQDPFIQGNRAYVAARPRTRHVFDTGGHDDAYWRSHAEKLIPWLGTLVEELSGPQG